MSKRVNENQWHKLGATNLLAQIFWVLVTDRAEILRDRLEERQDPSF